MERWKIQLYTVWLTQILSICGFSFGIPFTPFYIQELGITEKSAIELWVGFLNMAPAVALSLMAPLWGFLADKFGKKLMILRALLFGSLIVFLMGTVTSVYQLLALRTAQGLFTGTITASATLIASVTPRDKMAGALGFLSSSTFIGFTIGPFLGGIAAEWFGYRMSFFIGSCLLFCGFIIVLLKVREVRINDSREPVKTKKTRYSLRDLLSVSILIAFFMLTIIRFIRFFIRPFIPLFLEELLGKKEGITFLTGSILAVSGFFSAASGVVFGRIGDKKNKIKLIIILFAVSAVTILPVFLFANLFVFIIFYQIYVFFLGGIEPNVQSYVSNKIAVDKRGIVFGLQTAISSLGWAAGPISASLISINFSINYLFLASSIILVLAVVFLYFFRKHTY